MPAVLVLVLGAISSRRTRGSARRTRRLSRRTPARPSGGRFGQLAPVEEACLAQVAQGGEGDGHDGHRDEDADEPAERGPGGHRQDHGQGMQVDESALDHGLEQVALHLLHDHDDGQHGQGPTGAAVGQRQQDREQPGDQRADEWHERQHEGEQPDGERAGHGEDGGTGADQNRVHRGDGRGAVHVALQLRPGVPAGPVGERLGLGVEQADEAVPHHVAVPQHVEEGEQHQERPGHRLDRDGRHLHGPADTGVLEAVGGVLDALAGVGHGVLAEAVGGQLLEVVDPRLDAVGDHVGLVGDGVGGQRTRDGEGHQQEDEPEPGGHPSGTRWARNQTTTGRR